MRARIVKRYVITCGVDGAHDAHHLWHIAHGVKERSNCEDRGQWAVQPFHEGDIAFHSYNMGTDICVR